MRLSDFAAAVSDSPQARDAYLKRKADRQAERERQGREREAQRLRYEPKPDPIMLALHKQIDSLGLPDSTAEAFRALPTNEQRRVAEVASEDLAASIPVYLLIDEPMRAQALKVAGSASRALYGREPKPFSARLKMFAPR